MAETTERLLQNDVENTQIRESGADTKETADASAQVAKPAPAPYWTTWTEDGVGLLIACFIFLFVLIISGQGVDIMKDYSKSSQWPAGAVVLSILIVFFGHKMLDKPLIIESYCCVVLITISARAIGNYNELTNSGLSASLWAILIGIAIRSSGLVLNKGTFSGEFFVKIGVTLLAMDFTSIASIGLPGLIVAWLDTVIILVLGATFASQVMHFAIRDAIVVAGATCICGSSAATAISSSIHAKGYKDEVCRTIIAIMGVFNAPLMPLMPLARTVLNVNPSVVGAWIGGSIDSTGQVTASAQMGGNQVLKAAVIIKMAQNILIGPLCLLFTSIFQKSFHPSILIERFPLFVVGFMLTSAVVTLLLESPSVPHSMQDVLISNSWGVSEFITLLGFTCIGLEIDVKVFFSSGAQHRNILLAYLVIQCADLCSTFGWSYLMFADRDIHDDNNVETTVLF